MGQCASITGYSVDQLKEAKRAGCSAFRGSRIHRWPLERWMTEHEIITRRSTEATIRALELMKEKGYLHSDAKGKDWFEMDNATDMKRFSECYWQAMAEAEAEL